jgi:hypothetical protein
MAFNPFTSFRKYQKFWMATVLLLCMVTFVLCTGVGGDLSERLLRLFGRREGTAYFKVEGRTYYNQEVNALKEQRNLANEFIKNAGEMAVKSLLTVMHSQKLTPEERQKELPKLEALKAELELRNRKMRYFGTGVKLHELLDFKVWLVEADRLGIKLTPDHVRILLRKELLPPEVRYFLKQEVIQFDPVDHMGVVIRGLRTSRNVTEATILNALADEFRVRIAQLALEDSDRRNLVRRAPWKSLAEGAPDVRVSLSPDMLWDSFKANRSEFDVSLVPLVVDDFLKDVPAPTEPELQSLFNSHYKDRYDPTSPTPGFEIPTSTKVEFVLGDPESPKFKQWAKVAVLLEATPPAWIPTAPYTTLGRYAGGPLAQRSYLEFLYERIRATPKFRDSFSTSAWDESHVYMKTAGRLAEKHAEAAASWIGAYAQPSNVFTAPLGFVAFGPVRHPTELQAGLKAEAKERTPVYATLAASAADSVFQSLAMLNSLQGKEKAFALDVVKDDVLLFLERKQAQEWVTKNMAALRKVLDDPKNVGRKSNFNRELDKKLKELSMERHSTKEFYDRFTIDKAPDLKPLVKVFDKWLLDINTIEGRNLTPETMLKEGDFYRLFFDSTESFSAAGSTYKAKPWPPKVQPKRADMIPGGADPTDPTKAQAIELFDRAEQPALFWKVEDKIGKFPETIDLVHDRVEKAWKFLKARDNKALPRAKEVADALQKSEVGFGPALATEALKLGKDVINLKRVAVMYTDRTYQPANLPRAFQGGVRDYGPYTIPKDTFNYPRDDMFKEVLSLQDLKKPIEIGDPKLDEFNKALFDVGSKNGRMVQILTNKPRSAYYVACVVFNPGPSPSEFHSVLKYAFPSQSFSGGPYMDNFFDRAYEQAGKDFQRALMEQLRADTDSAILCEQKERESFDSNEAS